MSSIEILDCPQCQRQLFYRNLFKDHWAYCENCKIKWFEGSDLYSSWKDENEEIWEKNWEFLKDFKEINIDELL